MPCILGYTTPCHSMPLHAIPCHANAPCHTMISQLGTDHAIPNLCHTRLELLSLGLYHPIPCHTMLYHLIQCHTMESDLGTCHAMPCLSQRPPPSPSVCSLHCISTMWLIVPESYECDSFVTEFRFTCILALSRYLSSTIANCNIGGGTSPCDL